MPEATTPNGRRIRVGVHAEDQDTALTSTEPIACTLDNWTEEDVAEFQRWNQLEIKGRSYRITSPLLNGSFTIRLQSNPVNQNVRIEHAVADSLQEREITARYKADGWRLDSRTHPVDKPNHVQLEFRPIQEKEASIQRAAPRDSVEK
jgi:hypothetical protein